MIDPKIVRQNKDRVITAYKNRGYSLTFLDTFEQLDLKWRDKLQEVDQLKQTRNKILPKGKPSPEQLAELKKLSDLIKDNQTELQDLAEKVKDAALYLPNIPQESVPVGLSEDQNVQVRLEGDIPTFDFSVKSHEEIGQDLGWLDFDRAAAITGSRFVCLRGKGAKLERALIQFMLDLHDTHGYEEIIPPVVVNTDSLKGTGQLPKFEDDQFKLGDSDYYLSPTAEVQLTNLYKNTILKEEDLPIYVTAATACFRKEAGSYGKDVKGIICQHPFNKVELVQLVHPAKSMQQLDILLGHAEEVLKQLKLPYRVVELCTGDLGFTSSKTYDLEVWFPSQNMYREISSCSNFLDFQARRAMIRYNNNQEESASYVHTLNGSGLAIGRTFAAILENYQTSDGKVKIPDVLQKYLDNVNYE